MLFSVTRNEFKLNTSLQLQEPVELNGLVPAPPPKKPLFPVPVIYTQVNITEKSLRNNVNILDKIPGKF